MIKDRGKKLAFKPNGKFSTTHRTEGNSMASLTQTVVGKGIAEGLLKILRDLIPPIPTRIPC